MRPVDLFISSPTPEVYPYHNNYAQQTQIYILSSLTQAIGQRCSQPRPHIFDTITTEECAVTTPPRDLGHVPALFTPLERRYDHLVTPPAFLAETAGSPSASLCVKLDTPAIAPPMPYNHRRNRPLLIVFLVMLLTALSWTTTTPSSLRGLAGGIVTGAAALTPASGLIAPRIDPPADGGSKAATDIELRMIYGSMKLEGKLNVRLIVGNPSFDGSYSSHAWGSACSYGFKEGNNAANVVCSQLGYGRSALTAFVGFGPAYTKPSDPVWLDTINCTAEAARNGPVEAYRPSEPRLNFTRCRYHLTRPGATNPCYHSRDVGVRCVPPPSLWEFKLFPNATAPAFRFVGRALNDTSSTAVQFQRLVCTNNPTNINVDCRFSRSDVDMSGDNMLPSGIDCFADVYAARVNSTAQLPTRGLVMMRPSTLLGEDVLPWGTVHRSYFVSNIGARRALCRSMGFAGVLNPAVIDAGVHGYANTAIAPSYLTMQSCPTGATALENCTQYSFAQTAWAQTSQLAIQCDDEVDPVHRAVEYKFVNGWSPSSGQLYVRTLFSGAKWLYVPARVLLDGPPPYDAGVSQPHNVNALKAICAAAGGGSSD